MAKKKKGADEKPLALKAHSKGKQKKTSTLTCVIHYSRNKSDCKVRPLSEDSFKTIEKTVELRQSQNNSNDRLDEICSQVPKQYFPRIYGMHRWCYKNFTNVSRLRKRKDHPEDDTVESSMPSAKRRRSSRYQSSAYNEPSCSRKGGSSRLVSSDILLPADKCLFCDKKRKHKKGKEETLVKCVTKAAEQSIKKEAERHPSSEVFRKVNGVDLVAKEAHYHPSCRKEYTRADDRNTIRDNTKSKEEQEAHKAAFEDIVQYVEESIVKGANVERMSMLKERYLHFMLVNYEQFYNPEYKTYKLKAKLVRHFGRRLQFWQPNYKSELVYSSEVPKGQAVESAFEVAASESRRLEEAAMILRRKIISAQSTSEQMVWPPTARMLTDTIKPPECLQEFICHLIGQNDMANSSTKKQRLTSSISQDISHAVTDGQWMMPKHLLLGMTLRHLTGSAEIVTLINRFGHCTSYSRLLELETALCKSIEDSGKIVPKTISTERNVVTHLCWDNFDLMEETPSGAGTTHTAHGIIIQEAKTADDTTSSTEISESCPRTKDRTVTYKAVCIEPCFIKGKAEPRLTLHNTEASYPDAVAKTEMSDILWICSRTFLQEGIQKVPSWAGWVSISDDNSEDNQQLSTVDYLAPVFAPVTENATVQHILKLSQDATKEVGQQYTIVTFDLAVAKKAYALIWEKPQVFKDVLVRMGAFHLVCAYMSALGKSIRGSGFEEILIESGICASGSIERVMSGKHYNRALRVHKVVLEALERLLLQKFESLYGAAWREEDRTILIHLAETPCNELINEALTNQNFQVQLSRILEFKEKVRKGDHGKTAQFWMNYMDRVWLILQFQRATKQNNLELHLACLQRMCRLFFAYDHPNYARYTTVYLLSLLNLPHSHPGAEELLKQNGFSVSRSHVPSSRNAVDITIEQTINRHAKSRGGIIGFSRRQSAYYRWCMTRHARASYVEATKDLADMDNTDNNNAHNELRQSNITQSEVNTTRVVDAFNNFINPFEVECDNVLYCLSSGAPAAGDIQEDLLKADDVGEEAHKTFIQERLVENTKSFHSPISRQKLKTFANQAKKTKVTGKSLKTKQLTAERNVFAQLVNIAQKHEISMKRVMCYPLGPVPWSLATADGAPTTTDKAKLLHVLEGDDNTKDRPPLSTVSYIVDGNALLQAQVSLPGSFEKLAASIFDQLPKTPRVDFVTDSYFPLSIKGIERERRGSGKSHLIKGPRTKVPRDWKTFLSNDENKKQLIRFLLAEWKQNKYAPKFCGRQILFVCEETVIRLQSVDGIQTSADEVVELKSSQEEADPKIVLHCLHIASESADNATIIVRSPDTDVFILLLHFTVDVSQSILFDTGVGNKRRLIDVKKVASNEGNEICHALPALHAFTGCDTTSAFVKKGKLQPLKSLKQYPDFLDVFLSLGRSDEVPDSMFEKLEHFVCILYDKQSKESDINTLRHDKFLERCDASPGMLLSCSKGVDISLLPPCRDALRMHIRRANYQARIWYQADKAAPTIPQPDGHGWTITDDKLVFNWSEGELLPQELVEVFVDEPAADNEEAEDTDEDEERQEDEGDEPLNLLDIIYED